MRQEWTRVAAPPGRWATSRTRRSGRLQGEECCASGDSGSVRYPMSALESISGIGRSPVFAGGRRSRYATEHPPSIRHEPTGRHLQDSTPSLPRGAPEDYLIPWGRVSSVLLAQLEGGGVEPVPARPASTVVVVRQGSSSPEALLVRRPSRAGFAPGAWVFPGGAVDESDARLPPAEAVFPERWAKRLGLDDPAVAWGYVVAAARETWEETGILLGGARDPGMEWTVRERLEAGGAEFVDVVAGSGLRLEPGTLHYLAHWITPEVESRRFDTRFFLASVGPGVKPRLHGGELVEMRWLSPAEAVSGYHSGELPMLPPTIHTLRRIDRFRRVEELVAAVGHGEVPVYLPRMRPHPDGVLVTVAEPPFRT